MSVAPLLPWLLAAALTLVPALLVTGNSVGGLEARVFRDVNGLPALLQVLLIPVGQLGNLLAVPVAALAAIAARRRPLALELGAAGTLAWLLGKVVKRFVERGRPDEYLGDVVVRGAPQAGLGFVSGHAAALATVSVPYLPRKARWAPWALVALVCVSRIYVGAHLPLDVVGGAGLGLLTGLTVQALLRWRTPGPASDSPRVAAVGGVLALLLLTLVADWREALTALRSISWSRLLPAALVAILACALPILLDRLTDETSRTRRERPVRNGVRGLLSRVSAPVLARLAVLAVLAVVLALTSGGPSGMRMPPQWTLLAVIAVAVTLLGVCSGIARPRDGASGEAVTTGLMPPLRRAPSPGLVLAASVAVAVGFSLVLALAVEAFFPDSFALEVAGVNLVGSVLAAPSPLPERIGLEEPAIVAGLIAVGVSPTAAVLGVLSFRALTLWLPAAFAGLYGRFHLRRPHGVRPARASDPRV